VTLLGASKLFEPSGWLYATPAVVPELMNAALDFGRPILLQRIEADSALSRTIPGLTRGRALTVTRDTAPSMAVGTRGSWEAYHDSLSTRITVNLPRLRRKAERSLGPLEVVERQPQSAEVDDILGTLITIEDSGWKGRQGSSLAQRSDLRDFFRRYCRRAASQGRLRVVTLSFGTTLAAVELSIEAFDRLWQLKIGYHEGAAQYYPGLQLTAASIRAAFERGVEAYEFLGSAEAWEERWRPETRRYQALVVYPFNAAGVVTACRDFAGAMWRRAQTHA
jgi:CelD/BcsL family acetyltransferase involved in cellulose biosynthesis